jgi:hypothetical protein
VRLLPRRARRSVASPLRPARRGWATVNITGEAPATPNGRPPLSTSVPAENGWVRAPVPVSGPRRGSGRRRTDRTVSQPARCSQRRSGKSYPLRVHVSREHFANGARMYVIDQDEQQEYASGFCSYLGRASVPVRTLAEAEVFAFDQVANSDVVVWDLHESDAAEQGDARAGAARTCARCGRLNVGVGQKSCLLGPAQDRPQPKGADGLEPLGRLDRVAARTPGADPMASRCRRCNQLVDVLHTVRAYLPAKEDGWNLLCADCSSRCVRRWEGVGPTVSEPFVPVPVAPRSHHPRDQGRTTIRPSSLSASTLQEPSFGQTQFSAWRHIV